MPVNIKNIGSATIETMLEMTLEQLTKMPPEEFEAHIKVALDAIPAIVQRAERPMGKATAVKTLDLSACGTKPTRPTAKTKSKIPSAIASFMKNPENIKLKPIAAGVEELAKLEKELGMEPSETTVKLQAALMNKATAAPKTLDLSGV